MLMVGGWAEEADGERWAADADGEGWAADADGSGWPFWVCMLLTITHP